jgi:hypothetical protein
MEATQALKEVKKDITAVAKEAAGVEEAGDTGDTGDTGNTGDTSGIDEAALAEAGEVGAPPAPLIQTDALETAFQRLARERALTDKSAAKLVEHVVRHEKDHAHRTGHRTGFRRGFRSGRSRGLVPGAAMRPHDFEVFWRRPRLMQEFRYDVIERFTRRHGSVDSARGYYYGTFQIKFDVEGGLSSAAFVVKVEPPSGSKLNPVTSTAFDFAVGETNESWFGGPHTMDPSDTNFSKPGTNLWPNELFIIEAVATRFKGLRIGYFAPGSQPPAWASAAGQVSQSMLMGTTGVWDRDARIVPGEVFNDYSDVCEVAQAVAENGVFYLVWDDHEVGANEETASKLIDRMHAVPGAARRGVQETSGGALTLDLPRGFLWCLDEAFEASSDEGGNGILQAQLRVQQSVCFPFQPIQLYASLGPTMPIGLALEWQFFMYGTSLLPSKTLRLKGPRRRT